MPSTFSRKRRYKEPRLKHFERKIVTLLNDFAEELFKLTKTSRKELASTALEVSELSLVLTETDEYILEFEVLGQVFLLTPKGLFTFDEIGSTYTVEESFEKALDAHLRWRLKVLVHFHL
jgi:hypothetical protein